MKKIAWITDSTCGLSPEFAKENDIFIVPLNVLVNGQSFKEDIDITKEEFYKLLKEHGDNAKTSQPAFGDFIELYEKLKKEYDYGIAIHASSQLTGTYQSSISASEMTGFETSVIDSKIGDYALGKMIQKGIQYVKSGESIDTVVSKLRELPNQAQMYLMPQNTEQLRKSGRVSAAQSLFASLLNIHLILGFDNGKVIVKDKVRIKKRAKMKMFQLLSDAMEQHDLKEICIQHAGVRDQAEKWKSEIQERYHELIVHIQTLVPVAGVHTGHGTLCISWLKE
ncbi:DegV family protein with EDD domain [Gracilibacillus halotolerans]|uniref:DegV family protein with EDD domain n=1 Tax=Gracilibacillus halotolerans TaxID=74386 RepID=A0A841RJK8_9BACI|nr:DegV family protein [Gracilibacillus halotolerans]MBB6512689.1 DegV family protein with EDD domain [Gracilibacillus halotolerans]